MSDTAFRLLTLNINDDVLVLTVTEPHVRGDEVAEGLQGELFAALERHPARLVVIDLQHVTVMNSRGVGALAALHQEFVRKQGGRIALAALSPEIADLLALVRFIDSHGSRPILDTKEATPGHPRKEPLFPLVGRNVPAAIALLKAEPVPA